jgi:hypothetical protein
MNYGNYNQHAADYLFGSNSYEKSLSGDCDVGTQEVDDFDWNEFGVMVLTGFLQETAAETSAWFYILFLISLTKPEYSILE